MPHSSATAVTTRGKLRKLCDTDDEDDTEENHEVLERPAGMNNGKNKQPAKVSAMKVGQEERVGRQKGKKIW